MTDFKVGDRVRIVPSRWGHFQQRMGEVFDVLGVDLADEDYPARVPLMRDDDGDQYEWPHRTEIELVPTALDAAQAAVEAAKEGDVRSQVLAEASALINGARQEEYGTPQVNFTRIAKLWDVLVPREHPWTPAQVALAMAGVKLGRAVQGYKRDTATDLAGYAALWALLAEKEGK